MTRKGKLIRNLAVILAIFGAYFLLFGLYLSPERCALATARELYYGECTARGWADLPGGRRIYALATPDGEFCYSRVQRSMGLFWRTDGCGQGREMAPGLLNGYWTGGGETVNAVLLRLNPAVETVAWKGGSSSDWNRDIMVLELGWEDLEQTFQVRDQAGSLLWEGTY